MINKSKKQIKNRAVLVKSWPPGYGHLTGGWSETHGATRGTHGVSSPEGPCVNQANAY